jgi:diaminohydroxyphosphoribosylaminopyrimidine deaminase / 5-amino-6-(5-phosphoribosylamino)uracil reductase
LAQELDESYMRLALKLALKAEGLTSPNPLVGAVVIKSGKVVAKGYHKKAGLPHAEIIALRQAGSKSIGADLYVNLEPCCHQGRTPPCVDAIIKARVKRVVIGVRDPNHLINGKGIRLLRKNGIDVVTEVLKNECKILNESFFKYIKTGRPFVILKSALTLDGKIATRTGNSKWITGPKARDYVHKLRGRFDAVLVGAGTVLADNPRLTFRLEKSSTRNPIRIIVAGKKTIPISAKVFNNCHKERVIYATTTDFSSSRKIKLEKMGVEVLLIKHKRGRVNLSLLMDKLGKMKITSIMIEGGSEINGSVFKEKLFDKVIYFIAPKIIGGRNSPSPVGGEGVEHLKDFMQVKNISVDKLGDDLVIEGSLS